MLLLDTTAGVSVDAGEEMELEASVDGVPTDSAVRLISLAALAWHFFPLSCVSLPRAAY